MSEGLHGGRKLRILSLLYHSPTSGIAAGGFRRTYEIFKRAPDNVEILAVDNSPSFLRGMEKSNVQVMDYRIPRLLRRFESKFFIPERLVEWFVALLCMTFASLKLRLSGRAFDLIYVPSSEIFPSLLAGVAAKYIFNRKLILCNMNIDIYSNPVKCLMAQLHNSAVKVIALSKDLESKLRKYGTRVPIVINGAGIDHQFISAALNDRKLEKRFDAVFLGRLTVHKGTLDLAEIWSMVVSIFPAAKLLVIGSADPVNLALLQASIDEHGLQENIELEGMVDEERKFLLLKSSKLCLFPSHVEEWGIVPQEALACGLPVVLYDLPVYEENIKPCEAVFAFPLGDVLGMAEQTIELLSNKEYLEYEDIGPAYVSKFSWDATAEVEFAALTGDV
jgi:glycosyltransferase involved in cell wall biosynthesis